MFFPSLRIFPNICPNLFSLSVSRTATQLDQSINQSILSSINKRTHTAMLKQCTVKILSKMLDLSSSSGKNVTLSLSGIQASFDPTDARYMLSIEMKKCEIHNNSDIYNVLDTEECFILTPTPQDRAKVEETITRMKSDIDSLKSKISEATGKKGPLQFYNLSMHIP